MFLPNVFYKLYRQLTCTHYITWKTTITYSWTSLSSPVFTISNMKFHKDGVKIELEILNLSKFNFIREKLKFSSLYVANIMKIIDESTSLCQYQFIHSLKMIFRSAEIIRTPKQSHFNQTLTKVNFNLRMSKFSSKDMKLIQKFRKLNQIFN